MFDNENAKQDRDITMGIKASLQGFKREKNWNKQDKAWIKAAME